MKQLLIISGKGGTGKTTLAAAFIKLESARAYADCDVDAPNLSIVASRTDIPQKEDYFGLPKAVIGDKCIRCGACAAACRFGAIKMNGDDYFSDPIACEGCGVCAFVCPQQAITMQDAVSGELSLYAAASAGIFSTARLKVGSGASGKLVAEVKKRLVNAAPRADTAIIDGSPGIGCPVIASVSGADMALIVAEPTLSGISDMERVLQTVQTFDIPAAICVNKADLNRVYTQKIKEFCNENGLPFVGEVPYDEKAIEAVNSCVSIVDIDCPAGSAARKIYQKTKEILKTL